MPIKGKRELKNIRRKILGVATVSKAKTELPRQKKQYGRGPLSPRNEVQILLDCAWPWLNRYGEMLHANSSLQKPGQKNQSKNKNTPLPATLKNLPLRKCFLVPIRKGWIYQSHIQILRATCVFFAILYLHFSLFLISYIYVCVCVCKHYIFYIYKIYPLLMHQARLSKYLLDDFI